MAGLILPIATATWVDHLGKYFQAATTEAIITRLPHARPHHLSELIRHHPPLAVAHLAAPAAAVAVVVVVSADRLVDINIKTNTKSAKSESQEVRKNFNVIQSFFRSFGLSGFRTSF